MHYRADHPELDSGQQHRILSGGLDQVWTCVDTDPLDSSMSAQLLQSAS
jgi:hypothetical protein